MRAWPAGPGLASPHRVSQPQTPPRPWDPPPPPGHRRDGGHPIPSHAMPCWAQSTSQHGLARHGMERARVCTTHTPQSHTPPATPSRAPRPPPRPPRQVQVCAHTVLVPASPPAPQGSHRRQPVPFRKPAYLPTYPGYASYRRRRMRTTTVDPQAAACTGLPQAGGASQGGGEGRGKGGRDPHSARILTGQAAVAVIIFIMVRGLCMCTWVWV